MAAPRAEDRLCPPPPPTPVEVRRYPPRVLASVGHRTGETDPERRGGRLARWTPTGCGSPSAAHLRTVAATDSRAAPSGRVRARSAHAQSHLHSSPSPAVDANGDWRAPPGRGRKLRGMDSAEGERRGERGARCLPLRVRAALQSSIVPGDPGKVIRPALQGRQLLGRTSRGLGGSWKGGHQGLPVVQGITCSPTHDAAVGRDVRDGFLQRRCNLVIL